MEVFYRYYHEDDDDIDEDGDGDDDDDDVDDRDDDEDADYDNREGRPDSGDFYLKLMRLKAEQEEHLKLVSAVLSLYKE